MNKNKILSPIVLFVYNRLDHTTQTLETLKDNFLAKESNLYIYSDAAKGAKDVEAVFQVREYIQSISGFKNVTVIQRENNFGLAKSIIEGVSEIINTHGKVIVLEDDLISSKNFLCYINSALDYYENNGNIFSISAYSPDLKSLKKYNKDTYLSYRPSSWGWATWKHQWEGIDWNIIDFDSFIKNKLEVKKFNRGGIDMSRMLKHCMQEKNNSWAIRWSYSMYKSNKYSLHPKVSKIQNIGFGQDATHCSGANIYETKIDVSKNCKFDFTNDTLPSSRLVKEFRYQFSYTNKFLKRVNNYVKKITK